MVDKGNKSNKKNEDNEDEIKRLEDELTGDPNSPDNPFRDIIKKAKQFKQPDKNKEEVQQKQEQKEEFHSTSEEPQMSVEDANKIFKEESEELPPMNVDIPLPTANLETVDESGVQGLTEAMNSGSDLTDMQWTGEKLFPSKWGGAKSKINQMVGRLDPAQFTPKIHLNAVNKIMRTNLFRTDNDGNPVKDKNGKYIPNMIDVNEIYMDEYTIASIELDGFGRGELLELQGAAREEKRMDRQFGGLQSGMG